MKNSFRYILATAVLLPAVAATAQKPAGEGVYAIKATADIGLGKSMNAKSVLPGMSTSGSTFDFDLDFGWTFWEQRQHSLEANIGLGFSSTSLTSKLAGIAYDYSAPADADMDMDPYVRYYEISGMNQKVRANRLTLPIYLNYRYKLSQRVSLHALLGLKLGFSVYRNIGKATATAFSYGIYPQYDDLMIDATYMNCFGETALTTDQAIKPKTNAVGASIMTGIGAEIWIWGPLAGDISFRYEGSLTNMFKSIKSADAPFTDQNAPVTYTVAEGQTTKALASYMTRSKLSRFSLSLSLIYRF